MFTDIVGYTALMGQDEQKAIALLSKNREVHKPIINTFGGRLVKELGDGILASFSTVSDAVHAAVSIQQACMTNGEISLRIAIHYGEVIVEDQDVFGDAVNIASRIQPLGVPGSILISQKVHDEIANKAEFQSTPIGSFTLKNVQQRVTVFALTNAGLAVPKKRLTRGRFRSNRRTIIPLLLFIVLCIVFLLYMYANTNLNTIASEKSIAVLPFVNISGDQEQEYFSEGMMEEILNQLTKIHALNVTSRTTSMLYRDSKLSIREIAGKLGVANILEGSVRTSGDKIRITVQLIDAGSDKHLWSETFDRDMRDVFAIQTDIAMQTAKALRANLSLDEQKQIEKLSTASAEAYQLYLQGRYYWNKRLEEPLKKGIEYFLEAIDTDSTFARAYAGLGDSYLMLGVYDILPPHKSFPTAKKYIEKALQLDPSLGEAYATLVDINIHYDWDADAAEINFQKAIKYNPGYASAYHWHSEVLIMRGQFGQAILESQNALELEPYSLIINTQQATNYMYAGETPKAIDQLLKTLEFDSSFAVAQYTLGIAYNAQGQVNKALAHLRKAVYIAPDKPNFRAVLGLVEAQAGYQEQAQRIKLTLLNQAQHVYVPAYDLAIIELGLGNEEAALGYLEQAKQERGPWMPFLGVQPLFRSLKDNIRFQTILREIVPFDKKE